jgi:hypothetical protein
VWEKEERGSRETRDAGAEKPTVLAVAKLRGRSWADRARRTLADPPTVPP